MAFDALSGFMLTVTQNNQTFIAGDYFAVFEDENDMPDVYEWHTMLSYSELSDCFKIVFSRAEYSIPKNAFPTNFEIIHFRTIVEGSIAGNKTIEKNVKSRIIPPKYDYNSADISSNVYSGTGVYAEKEINTGSVSHIYGKIKIPIWMVAAAVAVAMFACLSVFGGNLEKSFIFYLVIAFFSGLGVGIVMYLILCIIARYRYAGFLKSDVSTVESIIFIVAPDGFGAIEQCIYSGKELIPWSFAKYFYETKYSVSIVCRDKSVCCIPKRLFQKNDLNDMLNFIASRVDQD